MNKCYHQGGNDPCRNDCPNLMSGQEFGPDGQARGVKVPDDAPPVPDALHPVFICLRACFPCGGGSCRDADGTLACSGNTSEYPLEAEPFIPCGCACGEAVASRAAAVTGLWPLLYPGRVLVRFMEAWAATTRLEAVL